MIYINLPFKRKSLRGAPSGKERMVFDLKKISIPSVIIFFIFSTSATHPQDKAGQTVAKNQENKATEKKDDAAGKDQPAKKDNIKLKPLIIKGEKEKQKKKKDIQVISRHTMTVDEIKEVPASFGDSVTALTALPGVIRAGGGVFGPLVIRGADITTNRYYIDDIPINDPLHFGGLHSVINTNLIKDVDIYASSFPAEFGSSTSAVINITTNDEVGRFSGYTDIGLLSVSALVQAPVLRKKDTGELKFDGPSDLRSPADMENAGYAIASGRYGYLVLGIRLAQLIYDNDVSISPEYWDYQFKGKYIFNSSNSITLLFFGHKDFIRFLIKEDALEEGDDPLMADLKLKSTKLSHSQAAYYEFAPAEKLMLKTILYNTMPESYFYINFGAEEAPDWAKDYHISSRPNVFGAKEKGKLRWLDDHAEARGALEYTLFYFSAEGKIFYAQNQDENTDFTDEGAAVMSTIDKNIYNHLFGGYLENKLTFGGFTALPGMRSEYLRRADTATFDPRLMLSYRFPTATTISAAGGRYSYFFQTNPYIFDSNPDVSEIGKELKPEKANHFSAGIEQEIDLFTIKIEGFNNYFYDKPIGYPHYEPDGTYFQGLSSMKVKAYGFELMIQKDSRENQNGLYGWFSYTYTHSRTKTGLPTEPGLYGDPRNEIGDPYGDRWITSDFEQRHCLKFISGYKLDNHILSGRLQYYTSFPYTPIVGSRETADYPGRYIPVYGYKNSDHFPSSFVLDLRYTYKESHSWGYVSWYVEAINVLNLVITNDYDYRWRWDRPYKKGSNPDLSEDDDGLPFLPNFGVEVKF